MFDFANSPVLNEEVTFLPNAKYVWDGQKWRAKRGREVFDPVPLISSIDPVQANQNEAFTLIVGGTYFALDSIITLDDIDAVTNYISTVQLTTDIPAQPYGKTSIAVNVRATALARSNADKILTLVDPRVPLIIAVNPVQANQGEVFTLTVIGVDFWSATQITLNGAPVTTTFVSGTELTTQVPAQPYGTTTLTVNVKSNAIVGTNPNQTVTLIDARPTVVSVSPIAGIQNEAITLTVRGTFFESGDQITANGTPIPTTVVSSTELTASYTAPYFSTTELGPVDIAVCVAGSISPSINVNFIDPRAKIRSFYPDSWTEWSGRDWIECWTWGLISAQSVIYQYNVGETPSPGDPRPTQFVLNGVGTEMILTWDLAYPSNGQDQWVEIRVWNPPHHWSPDPVVDFYCDFAFAEEKQ